MQNSFQPVNPLIQLLRRLLIWGTFEVLFLRVVLGASWFIVALFMLALFMFEAGRFFYKKSKATPLS
ncbi:hypothetical protein [Pedobacter faecalis]|uniref:hypothetical protein n=1 Tax=Pedobacter faecalis TaxID=3041495 RepID=UPI00255158D0|nr:hypothetical protein [Pedobacter sp. ELA7]